MVLRRALAFAKIRATANKFAVAGFGEGEMVEAGGVEPPSEKRYGSKPTCLARFRFVSPAALGTSKKRSRLVRLVLAVLPRTETLPASLLCDASCRARRRSSGRRATLVFARQPKPTRCWQF